MTPSPNSRRSRIINAGCASVLFLVMGLFLWMYWTSKQQLYPPEHLFVADQSNPSDTAAAFAFSLAHNQLEGMQSYLVEEKWLLIATWPQTHEALSDSCRFDWDPDFQGYTAVGGLSRDRTEANFDLWFNYVCPNDSWKEMSVDVSLRLIDGKWYIVEWHKLHL